MERIVTAVRGGAYAYQAAKAAGVGKSTYYEYLATGREAIDAIDEGRAEHHVVAFVEVDSDNFRELVAKGVADPAVHEIGDDIAVLVSSDFDEHTLRCMELVERVEEAEAEAETRMALGWQQHGKDDYRAYRDFMARRWPSRWKEIKGNEVSGPDGQPLTIADMGVARLIGENPEARKKANELLALVADDGPQPDGGRTRDASTPGGESEPGAVAVPEAPPIPE